MIQPKIIIHNHGPIFIYDKCCREMFNLPHHPGGYIIFGEHDLDVSEEIERDIDIVLSHEVLHSLLIQMHIDDHALDELRHKYKHDKEWSWIFYEI